MKKSKRQAMMMVGFAMVILSGIMIYISLSSPRVYDDYSQQKPTFADKVDVSSEDTSVPVIVPSKQIIYPLDINSATIDELMTIDGVGEKRASDIIAYRSKLGGYTSVEQIKNIKGIGESLYNRIAPYLKV